MKAPRSLGSLATALFTLAALLCATGTAARAGDDGWMPVDPAHLALKAPVVEKDADAEAIFWDVRVDDASMYELVFTHYVRIKVFTERGREAQSKVEIPYMSGTKIQNVSARTIKPDGTIVELKKEDVFDSTKVKVSGLKLKTKTFALPGVEPGSIIEYRWREVLSDTNADYVRLRFQREIPIQTVSYHVKPFAYSQYGMRAHFFNMPAMQPKKGKGGFYDLTLTNVPAFHEEPNMPPEDQVRSWTLIYYSPDEKLSPEKYWKEIGRRAHDVLKSGMKANDEIKRASAEIVAGAQTPEEKLERIFNFCRAKIKNTSDDASGLTAVEREQLKENKSPADTLKRGVGNGRDIDMLFAALASAAGFDPRIAWTADRSDFFFDPSITILYFMEPSSIAVKVGDAWRFYNPGYNYIPSGSLRWQEEGTQTLITDPKEPQFVSSPMTAPEKSRTRRTAKLRLSEDGTLEGDVQIEYTGHAAVDMKEQNDDDSPAEREETLKNLVRARLSTAEVSNIRVENASDASKPFLYTYHVRVPGYAQRTGKRLFVQPAFFQRNVGQVFPTSERRNEVYFRYPWSEDDQVEIELPEGFTLDNAESPASFGASDLSRYNVRLGVTNDKRTLIYSRSFFFGGPPANGGLYDMNRLRFDRANYAPLKQYFDQIHKQDGHTISLKQDAASKATSSN